MAFRTDTVELDLKEANELLVRNFGRIFKKLRMHLHKLFDQYIQLFLVQHIEPDDWGKHVPSAALRKSALREPRASAS